MDPEKKAEQTATEQSRRSRSPIRAIDLAPEIRAERNNPAVTVEGYSSTFWAVDSYWTAMHPEAFSKTLRERADDIRVLYNHNPEINFGVPVKQELDEKGLRVEVDVVDDGADGTVFARRLRGGVKFGFSFGFRLLNWRMATEDDPLDFTQHPNITRNEVVVYTEVKLYEHSLVTFPANEDAAIESIRSQAIADALGEALENLRNGKSSERERALLAQISAALGEQPDGTAEPLPFAKARNIDAAMALARLRLYA